MIAVIVPPSTISSTVTTTLIIIIISGGKFHVVQWMSHKRIFRSYSSKPSNSQWILSTATSYLELFVVEMESGLVLKLKVNPQFPLASLGEAV